MAMSKTDLEKFLAADPEELYALWEAGDLKVEDNKMKDNVVSDYSASKFEPTLPPVDFSKNREKKIEEEYRFDLFEDSKKKAENVKGSTSGKSSRATKKTRKVDSKVIINRMKALALAGIIIGGVALTSYTANEMEEASLVNPHVISFRHEVMDNDNVHRTYDNQGYFYDYDDISEFLTVEGDDFSRRLFIMVEALGVYQTNRVLEHVPGVNSVADYVKDNNFEDIDAWKNNEVEKLKLERDIAKQSGKVSEKKEELNGMFSDTYETPKSEQTDNGLGGVK